MNMRLYVVDGVLQAPVTQMTRLTLECLIQWACQRGCQCLGHNDPWRNTRAERLAVERPSREALENLYVAGRPVIHKDVAEDMLCESLVRRDFSAPGDRLRK
jgi:hypothetical protein